MNVDRLQKFFPKQMVLLTYSMPPIVVKNKTSIPEDIEVLSWILHLSMKYLLNNISMNYVIMKFNFNEYY